MLYQFVDLLREELTKLDAEQARLLRSVDPENLRRQQGVLAGISMATMTLNSLLKRYES